MKDVHPPSLTQVARFRASMLQLDPQAGRARLGLAVSGGPDSLALLLLGWAAFPGRVEAATVDHGLRPEAAAEALSVAELCAAMRVPHAILHPSTPIAGNLQSQAREARYRLLTSWCAERRCALLATAHQMEDQAETLMMRLLRGSGVSGLAGVRARSAIAHDVALVRPLLGWRRHELEEIVSASGISAVTDPSNSDPRFDRARMRRRLASAPWIDPEALAASAAALADAEMALRWTTERAWHARVAAIDNGYRLDPRDLPDEFVRRLILRILQAMSIDAAPRGRQVQHLLHLLRNGGVGTLAGVKCTGGELWEFSAAPPRRDN